MKLNVVHSVTATPDPTAFIIDCNITDMYGETYDCDYCTRPGDANGVNPTMQQWLADDPDFPIQPYVPPTEEEDRAAMQQLSARQLRLGLLAAGSPLP